MYKTLDPIWNQTFEFSDDGSPLILHVKDHKALLRTSNIGDCVVEYQSLPPNKMADLWLPLQGVKKGEIHVQITRKLSSPHRVSNVDSDSSFTNAHKISSQVRQFLFSFMYLIMYLILTKNFNPLRSLSPS